MRTKQDDVKMLAEAYQKVQEGLFGFGSKKERSFDQVMRDAKRNEKKRAARPYDFKKDQQKQKELELRKQKESEEVARAAAAVESIKKRMIPDNTRSIQIRVYKDTRRTHTGTYGQLSDGKWWVQAPFIGTGEPIEVDSTDEALKKFKEAYPYDDAWYEKPAHDTYRKGDTRPY
jgi:hypothetical protein